MAKSTTPKLLLSYAEAAEQLGISERSLWGLCNAGEIRAISIGRCRRIPFAELQRFISDRLSNEPAE